MKIKTVFFGTPEFAVESLDALLNSGVDVAAVVTMPDKIAGRGHKLIQSDVKKYALEHNLPLLQPEKLKNPDFIESLKAINADLFVVIAFRMLPEIVWKMPRLGTFNLHASLLPKYRGAAPINHAIINGESKTGVTTFFLKHEIDTGDIISQEEIIILPEDNAGTIHDKLMHLGARKVVETIKKIEDGTLSTIPQPQGQFTPAPKIYKETCKIDWSNNSRSIHNLIRGLSPYPAAWSTLKDENGKYLDVKIFESALTDEKTERPTGEIIIKDHRLFVATGNNEVIEILSLQPSGKKRMDSSAFLLGYKFDRFIE